MKDSFNSFEKFAFLFAILTFTFSGCFDLLWAWGLGRWVTPAVMPYFGRHTTLLTGIGVFQLVLSSAVLLTSYAVDEHQTRRHPMFFIAVLITCLMMLAGLGPLAIFTAVTPLDNDHELYDDMVWEAAGNRSSSVLEMAFKHFNCCGVYNETICSKEYPPFFVTYFDVFDENVNETITKNTTEIPCYLGSELCSQGCLDPVLTNLVIPYRPVGQILAYVVFGLSIAVPVFLALAIFSNWYCPCYQPYYTAKAKANRRQPQIRTPSGKNRTGASNDSSRLSNVIDEVGEDDDDLALASPRPLLESGMATDLSLIRGSNAASNLKKKITSSKTANDDAL